MDTAASPLLRLLPPVPDPYRVSDAGVFRGPDLIARTPMALEAVLSDAQERLHWRIVWLSGGAIRRRILHRAEALDGKLSDLATHGADCGKHNARAVARYFQAQELDRPVGRLADQLGWDEGMGRFLWGDVVIEADGPAPASPSTILPAQEAQTFSAGWGQVGTLDGWLAAAREAAKYPRAALALCAAAAPPLLRVLGAPNLAVQWSGPGSSGKSACVQLAASAWGDPDRLIARWGSEPAWLSRRAQALRDLPFFLDDPRDGLDMEARMGLVLVGASEGRVERGIPLPPVTWSTVLIAAGTASMDPIEDEALSSRVFDLWGPPFGGQAQAMARSVAVIQDAMRGNYGHFGPLLLQRALGRADVWPRWRSSYQTLRREFSALGAEQGGKISRTMGHLASLRMVAQIVQAIVPELEWDIEPMLADLKRWVETASNQAPQADAAMAQVEGWIAQNQARVHGLREVRTWSEEVPPGGWIGTMDHEGKVWIIQGLLSESLASWGFVPERIIREWWESGALLPGHRGHPYARKRVGTYCPPCIGFRHIRPKAKPRGAESAM